MSRGRDDSPSAPDLDDLLAAWSATPAIVRDRYLGVRAANPLARALSPAFRPGTNLVRWAFTEAPSGAGVDSWQEPMSWLVTLLRDSLDQHEEDRGFVELVGELAAGSGAFAALWAEEGGRPPHRSTVVFPDTSVGRLRMTYQELRLPLDYDSVVVVWQPADRESQLGFEHLLAEVAAGGD